MQTSIFTHRQYAIFFGLLAVVYLIGLLVPLMDNDSAHHANIALHMHLTGNYVNLIDHGKDYLDKPHLHFWLAAFSYKIFGVTGFAYKLPSFLFTLLGTYSTYRLGKRLYSAETGRLAALIVASSFAYILANNDVRMDAILTTAVALATWQLVAWVDEKKALNAAGAALGLALGFCTKGHIAVLIPAVGVLAYIVHKKSWRSLYHQQLLLIITGFFVLIAPVVYCYYLQYDLHPEKVIRGKSGRSGVAFILWKQNFERFQGDSFGADGKNDYLFFFHSFLWAFAPWSVLTFMALVQRIKQSRQRQPEWLTVATILVMVLLMTFSGFKLPHYLNIIFPVAAVLCAAYITGQWQGKKSGKALWRMQAVISSLCMLIAIVVNAWAFPVSSWLVVGGVVSLVVAAVLLLKQWHLTIQKLVGLSVLTSVVVFYSLNSNFYPQLLTYQGGNQLAFATGKKVAAKKVWFWPGVYSSSYNFYTAELRKEFTDAVLSQPSPVWVMVDGGRRAELTAKGLPALDSVVVKDYEITTLQLPFIAPATRQKELGSLQLIRVK